MSAFGEPFSSYQRKCERLHSFYTASMCAILASDSNSLYTKSQGGVADPPQTRGSNTPQSCSDAQAHRQIIGEAVARAQRLSFLGTTSVTANELGALNSGTTAWPPEADRP
jgi:hypothetical protein